MLMPKPLDAGEIVSLKLQNGDELIGKLVYQDTIGCTLSQPRRVVAQPGQPSLAGPLSDGFGFLPFLISAQDGTATVTVPLNALLTRAVKTRPDVAALYQQSITPIPPTAS